MRANPHCENCATDLHYEGMGEWRCACGESKLADWLDGPGLCRWIAQRANLYDVDRLVPSFARRMNDWKREGAVANAYTVDKWLVRIGLHLSQVPDHLWRQDYFKSDEARHRHQTGNRVLGERARVRRRRAVARYQELGSWDKVAQEFGVHARTASGWGQIERQAAA